MNMKIEGLGAMSAFFLTSAILIFAAPAAKADIINLGGGTTGCPTPAFTVDGLNVGFGSGPGFCSPETDGGLSTDQFGANININVATVGDEFSATSIEVGQVNSGKARTP